MTPKQRRLELIKNKFCLQCLVPGVKYYQPHVCYKKYACPDTSHNRYPKGVHILVCEDHKNTEANSRLLQEYKQNVISKRSNQFENFTTNISLLCYIQSSTISNACLDNVLPDVPDSAVFYCKQSVLVESN